MEDDNHDQLERYMDPMCAFWDKPNGSSPAYFAFHICNDPHFQREKDQLVYQEELPPGSHSVNIEIDRNLVVYAKEEIRPGDELFLNYGLEDGHVQPTAESLHSSPCVASV